mmetsp:Transcript_78051/g.154679  ORF Transcript_78051/g.154679 Transcript_78051/m.154679 type:complete len:109 (+) Transcript_78051:672-998(+)
MVLELEDGAVLDLEGGTLLELECGVMLEFEGCTVPELEGGTVLGLRCNVVLIFDNGTAPWPVPFALAPQAGCVDICTGPPLLPTPGTGHATNPAHKAILPLSPVGNSS